MIVPLLIIGGGILTVSLLSRPTRPIPVEQVSGIRRVQRPAVKRQVTPCIEMVAKHLRLGIMPSEQLVYAAVREAERIGHYQLAEALWNAGERAFLKKQAASQPEEAEPEREQLPESPDEDVPQIASPLEGVADDEWQDFILAMRDKEPNFENERHVGAFHHAKSRIAKLGVDPSTVKGNEALQVELFQKDLASRAEEASDLINAVSGQEIEIDGSTHVITRSGVLALIKVAGPERARDWIEDPSSREKFPKTKELFLKCNLLF